MFYGKCDGASKGNPGEASVGYLLKNEKNETVFEKFEKIGITTNNVAEYTSLIKLLRLCKENKVDKLKVSMDSLLVVNQIKGIYAVKKPHLKKLYNECISLISAFTEFSIEHNKRKFNSEADMLANKAFK